jgi:hypothetical protein
MRTERKQLDHLFMAHAVISLISGTISFAAPHSMLSPILGNGNNSHFAHEFVRLYGEYA